jgi:hypothetical protein
MPRFYFHVDGPPDNLGMDLPNVAAAKCAAVRYAGQLICEEANSFWDSGDFEMTVTDEDDLVLFSLVLTGIDAPAIQMKRVISS